jgi:O-antigen/teichoic acid export membrane protein
LKAGSWALTGYGAETVTRLFSNLILARLLFPEAFGATAAAMALILGLIWITDLGVRAVVIQSSRGEQVEFLRSAWTFQLLRGVALWIILLGLCALIYLPAIRGMMPAGSIFADPSFATITAALGIGLVLNGAESMAIALNVRHLNYRPIIMIDLLVRLLSMALTLIWAWLAPSVWALVGGILAGGLARLVLSHIMLPGPSMGLSWDKVHFREIVQFGRWIAVSSIATFFSQQSDVLILGFLTSGSILGLYSIAKLLTGVGEGLLDRLNSALALPILGETVRQNPHNLQKVYYRFRLPIDLTAGLLGGTLFATGDFVVRFLYDARYTEAGLMLQILALSLLSYPFLIIGNAFTATGDTHINAYVSLLKAASLLAFLGIGYLEFGAVGAVGGIALHRVIPSLLIAFLARGRNWVNALQELRIFPAFIVGIVLGRGIILIAEGLGIENLHQLVHYLRIT